MTSTKHEAHLRSGLFASNPLFTKIKDGILDLIFPPMCHSCGRVDTRWCNACLDELMHVAIQLKDYEPEILTGLCATGHHVDKLQEAIQALKYNNTRSLAEPLGLRLVTTLRQKNWTFDIIIPVPLFTDRLKKRGYNQAYLLSQQVEQQMTITCQPNFLTRYRDTSQQVGLTAQERRENVKDAFIATDDVADKSILLIDDVVTTGSTLDECATALFRAGAKAVYAITVSHA